LLVDDTAGTVADQLKAPACWDFAGYSLLH
jgi:hypothetical protein